jgi:predicted esterase
MIPKPRRTKKRWRFLQPLALALLASVAVAKPASRTGSPRRYHLFVPDDLGGPAPAILLLHASGRNGESLIEGWRGLAQKEKIILVAPEAIDGAEWDYAKDSPDFLNAVLEQVGTQYPIDKRRIYLFGNSAGAVYALYLSIVESEYFAATAVHSGALPPSDFRLIGFAPRKIPIAIWEGSNDTFFPPALVQATRDAFQYRHFTVEFHELKGRDHDYFAVAGVVNKVAWQFLREMKLEREPKLLRLAQLLHPALRVGLPNQTQQNMDIELTPHDFNLSIWTRAQPYLDDPLPQLIASIPQLRGLEPSSSQGGLAELLRHSSEGCVELLNKTPNLISREDVTVKFGSRGPVSNEHFDFLVLRHENAADGEVTLEEYRTDNTGAAKPVLSRGGANAWVMFHPGNLDESRFRYLGRQAMNGHSTAVVGFTQIPDRVKYPGHVTFGDSTIPVLFQGIAWIDESTFRIVRIRTDMLVPRPDIYLSMLSRDVLFSEVRIQASEISESFWLPEEVDIIWDFEGQTVSQKHRYTEYHLYHSKSKIIM